MSTVHIFVSYLTGSGIPDSAQNIGIKFLTILSIDFFRTTTRLMVVRVDKAYYFAITRVRSFQHTNGMLFSYLSSPKELGYGRYVAEVNCPFGLLRTEG